MGIKVPTNVFNAVMAVFKQTDVYNTPDMMAWYMRTVKEEEVAKWIEAHKAEFKAGIMAGFEIDNSQDAQLKGLHNRENKNL